MPFADELRRLRKKEKMTQAELATALNISKSAISMYECGNREPDYETLEMIADFFNVDLNFLFGSDPMQKVPPYFSLRNFTPGSSEFIGALSTLEDYKLFSRHLLPEQLEAVNLIMGMDEAQLRRFIAAARAFLD